MKKSNLKISENISVESDLLFAIVTVEHELKVCMLLNEHLKISLTLGEDIVITNKSGTRVFRKYEYEDEDGIEKYILIVNKCDGNILFKELKQVDFLFIVKSESNLQAIEKPVLSLRSLNAFTVINKIAPSKIRKYNSLGE